LILIFNSYINHFGVNNFQTEYCIFVDFILKIQCRLVKILS